MDIIHADIAPDDTLDRLISKTATIESTIYAIDFGTGDALAIHGPSGSISKRLLKLARVKGGKTPAMEFPMIVDALMTGGDDYPGGDVVVESATIGASGCEVDDILQILERNPDRKLFTISCRAVKNYRADNAMGWAKGARYAKDGDIVPVMIQIDSQPSVHVEDAEIIYRIATEQPYRLYHWTGPSTGPDRIYTSVRPMDKRGYRDATSERFMSLLPPFASLPMDLQEIVGNGKDYRRSIVMPFAMASEEPYLDEGPLEKRRRRYEKLIGLYDRGYPSFYRRATITFMHIVAKQLTDATRIGDVTPQMRKEAWKITQRQIRKLFHLTMQHQGR